MKTLIILAALMLQSGAFQYVCLDQEDNRLKLETSEEFHVGDTVFIDSMLRVIAVKPKQIPHHQRLESVEIAIQPFNPDDFDGLIEYTSPEDEDLDGVILIDTIKYDVGTMLIDENGHFILESPIEAPQRDNTICTQADIRAEYPGGEAAFRDYVKYEFIYPSRCQSAGINGSVNLRFIVDKTGRISNIQILSETVSCPEFTQEAIRVLKASKRWIPAQLNGNFVTAWRELPITASAN